MCVTLSEQDGAYRGWTKATAQKQQPIRFHVNKYVNATVKVLKIENITTLIWPAEEAKLEVILEASEDASLGETLHVDDWACLHNCKNQEQSCNNWIWCVYVHFRNVNPKTLQYRLSFSFSSSCGN